MSEITDNLDKISSKIAAKFTRVTKARDEILQAQRDIIRFSSQAVRSIHRSEFDKAEELLNAADSIIADKRHIFETFPELYFAGYFLDAQKELAEARITFALTSGKPLPDPDELNIEYSAYVNGMGEAVGELRRYILDKIRHDSFEDGEVFLDVMEELYCALISLDFPDAITRGLRRTTDVARSIIEKTRGDLTQNIAQKRLARKIDESRIIG